MPEIPVLSWIGDRLNDWQENVVDDKVLGHGLRALRGGLQPTHGYDPLAIVPGAGLLRKAIAPGMNDALLADKAGLTGKAWVDAAYKNSPWQHAGASMLLDPLNLVGMGLPTKALTAVPTASKLVPLLKAAEFADMLPGRATKPVFDIAGRGASGLVGGTADFLRPHASQFASMHPQVNNAIDNVMRGWREQALLSPGYHVRNVSEGIIRPIAEGRMDTANEVIKNMTGRSRWDRDAAKYGLDQDVNVLKEINQDPTGGTLKQGSVYRKVDFGPKATPATPTRLPSPGPNANVADYTLVNNYGTMPPPPGLAPGATGPKQYQGVVLNGDTVQLGDTGHFTVTTGPGQVGKMDAQIVDIIDRGSGLPYFMAEPRAGGKQYMIRADRLQAHTPGPGWTNAASTPGTPNILQRAGNKARDAVAGAAELNAKGGRELEGRMRKAAILTEYEKAIKEGATHQQAVDGAIKHSQDLFFNYADQGPVDQLGRNLFAFHKFGMHNLPAQLRNAGARPAIMNIPSDYYRASDEYNQQKGLPSRFHGEMPLGNTGWHINPMMLSSMGQLVGAASKRSANDNEGTAIGEAGDLAQGLGLGLNPFIDAMLTVTGQHGRTFAPSFLRASQPVNGVLSALADKPVDLEGLPKELLGNVQEAITGQRPFPYQEYLLNKRRAELRDLGGDPSKAGEQVGDTMAAEGLAGFMGIPGLKLLTPEEQTIRRNSALAKAYKLAGNDKAYKANPTARTYADLDPRDAQVANWENLSAADRQRLLRDPEVRDQLLDKLAFQLHNTGGKSKSPNPFMKRAEYDKALAGRK
jgi:hypothetical protein